MLISSNCTEGLVEQQQLWPLHQCARQRHALPLATGELVRLALGELAQPHDAEDLLHPRGDLGLRELLLLQAESDVLFHRHVGEQRIGLEHHVHGPLVGRNACHVLAIQMDAAAAGFLETGHHAQQRRLAAAGAAQQAEDLALVDFQRDIVDGDEVPEPFGDVVDAHIGLCARVPPGLVLVLVVAAFRHVDPYLPVRKRVQARVSSRVNSALSGRSGTSLGIICAVGKMFGLFLISGVTLGQEAALLLA
jgi:hypothetical protein